MDPTGSLDQEEILSLRRELEETRQRAEAERQRAEAERQRADEERQRAETAELRTQNTTFSEFLEACHQQVSKPLFIESRPEFRTKGGITSPAGRVCPTYLQPWDFRAENQPLFDKVYQLFHSALPRRVFPSLPVIEDRGRQACFTALSSESDLVKHQAYEVEIPVREVIEQLRQIPAAYEEFALQGNITFSNHTNSVTEQPGQPPSGHSNSLQPRADQNCVYLGIENDRRLLYIIEYKAAHKLTDAYLRAGLYPMDMYEQVVQRATIPTDPKEKLQYNAELLSCAAATQTFEYMMKAGLEYGVLTNGRVKVMLRVLEDDPTTLHYCLLEPTKDAEPDEYGFRYPYTAVGCHVSLTLLVLQSQPRRSQHWRNSAIGRLHRWRMDFGDLIRKIPDEEREESPPASEYRPPRYPLNPNSPYLQRRRSTRQSGCAGPSEPSRPAADSSSGSDPDAPDTNVPSSPVEARERRKRKRPAGLPPPLPPAHPPQRPPNSEYCTQKCLLGLSHQSSFDAACPNVHIHKAHSNGLCHPVNRLAVVQMTQHQLNWDPEHCCHPLGIEGLHGVLFAVTLEPYGYTFVGKGTKYNSSFEGQIYEHLKNLQGTAIPVYLGDIYLTHSVYYLRPDYVITHMSLMAWGGKTLEAEFPTNISSTALGRQISQTRDEIRTAGVVHQDERLLNMLWNDEMQRVMFIDFGRAQIRPGHLKRDSSVLDDLDNNTTVRREPAGRLERVDPVK